MEQGLTVMRVCIVASIIGVLGMSLSFSCKPKERSTNTMTSTMEDSNTTPSTKDDSQRLAQQMLALKEIPLPDDWYSVTGTTVAERFEATARVMRAKDANAPTLSELMAQYENGGKPFIHSVWLNQPLVCSKCSPSGGDGFFTVTSVARGLSIVVKAAELHAVTAHGEAFPPETLSSLKKILDPN